jgi:hypothetical protein
MDFVRAHGILTPRILGHDIRAKPIGSEYILMEKLPGRPIGDAWFELPEQQRLDVLHAVMGLQSKLFNMQLPASGSIYYTRDLETDTPKMNITGFNGRFSIDPYAGLCW